MSMQRVLSIGLVLVLLVSVAGNAHAQDFNANPPQLYLPPAPMLLTPSQYAARASRGRTLRTAGLAVLITGIVATVAGGIGVGFSSLKWIFDENDDYSNFGRDIGVSSAALILGQGSIIAGSCMLAAGNSDSQPRYLQVGSREQPTPPAFVGVEF